MKPRLLHNTFACVFTLLLVLTASSQQYTFTTIAGTVGAVGAQDGTNFQARFNFPAGVAVDDRGFVYVCDLLNHTVRQLRPDGGNWIVTTIAGLALTPGSANGTNSDARFDHPAGIAVRPDGSVFVADKFNNCIRKVTPVSGDWVVTTIAGQPGAGAYADGVNNTARFWGPAGLAFDNSNRLYVADSSNYIIRRIVPDGADWVVSTIAGTPQDPAFADGTNQNARFNYPWAVTVNSAGVLYVADLGNSIIRRLEQTGADWITTTLAGIPRTPGTNDGPVTQAMFRDPIGVSLWQDNQVFATDWSNHTLRKAAPEGVAWYVRTVGGAPLISGSADGPGVNARFRKPYGVTVAKTGTLFVADYSNQTIRMGVSLPSLQITLAGNQVVLSWPLWANNYVLEKSALPTPAPAWTIYTNGVAVSGSSFVLTNDIAGSAFFRLRQQ